MRDIPYTLWRGERVLGAIHLVEPLTLARLVGVLVPAVPTGELESLMQTRPPILPTRPIFQRALAPVRRDPHDGPPSNPGPIALTPLTDEEVRGVPRAQQLVLRDAHDAALDPYVLTLRAFECPAAPRPPQWAALPPGVIVDGWLWHVVAAFAVAES
jgi:hypothetical protein